MQDERPNDEFPPVAVTLRDGRSVTLRSIRPGDVKELRDAFNRLGEESRYTRFFATIRELPAGMLETATHSAPDRRLMVVALSGEGDDEDIVGGAHYVVEPGGDSCEFAVTVADDWHGAGLARRLMETLIGLARSHSLKRMDGYVMSDNTAMRGLVKRLGFTDVPSPGDRSVRLVSLPLT